MAEENGMKHCGTQRIETVRLILRRFEEEDAQAMFSNWASDPEVTKFLMWPPHSDVYVSRSVLHDWIQKYGDDGYYQWAIVLKETQEPIGSIGVVDKNDSIPMAHIGYCIGRAHWRKGITAEALAAVMDFLFDEVGYDRIESRHDPRNPNSGKVMLKCGMKYEGTLRMADRNNQGICDAAYYALLRSER